MKRSIALVVLVALAGTAAAGGDKNKADVLFKKGRKLLAEKRYADACQAFEDSYNLDPEIGAELNVALCYEEWGKLARAYRAYDKAAEMATSEHDSRLDKIQKRKNELDPEVPRLTIVAPQGADTRGLTVTIDDKPLQLDQLGQAQLVDPGPHIVEWTQHGAKKNKVVPIERGGSSQITLELSPPKVVPDTHEDEHPVQPVPTDTGSAHELQMYRYGAYAGAGVGAVLIGVSSALTLSARSKYNDALKAHCMNTTNMCDPQGLSTTHDARHEANIATALFISGAVIAGGGIALYFLAPRLVPHSDEHAMYVVPTLGPDGAGLVLGGKL